MTPQDLSPILQKVYDALPENQREEFLEAQRAIYGQAIRGGIAQVFARNTSHHVGKHVICMQVKKVK